MAATGGRQAALSLRFPPKGLGAIRERYAVSRVVNSVKNDTEECIEPVEEVFDEP
jgi:hypothetical protein